MTPGRGTAIAKISRLQGVLTPRKTSRTTALIRRVPHPTSRPSSWTLRRLYTGPIHTDAPRRTRRIRHTDRANTCRRRGTRVRRLWLTRCAVCRVAVSIGALASGAAERGVIRAGLIPDRRQHRGRVTVRCTTPCEHKVQCARCLSHVADNVMIWCNGRLPICHEIGARSRRRVTPPIRCVATRITLFCDRRNVGASVTGKQIRRTKEGQNDPMHQPLKMSHSAPRSATTSQRPIPAVVIALPFQGTTADPLKRPPGRPLRTADPQISSGRHAPSGRP